MDKKTIMAFVLIGIVIIFLPYYQQWVNPVDPQAQQQREVSATQAEPEPPVTSPPPTRIQADINMLERETPLASKEIVITNNKYAMVLSNLGGGTVRGYTVFEYPDHEGNPLQLLPDESAANLNLSFTNIYQDPSRLEYIAFDCPQLANFKDGDTLFIDREISLSYTALSNEGVRVEKNFTFFPDRYDFRLHVVLADYMQRVSGLKYTIAWENGFAITEANAADDIMYSGLYAQMGSEMAKLELQKAKEGEEKRLNTDGRTDWVAFKSKYFTGFIAPIDNKGIRSELTASKEKQSRGLKARIDMGLSKNDYHQDTFIIGLVPAEKSLLASYDMGLQKTMNWGGPIIRPFSIALHWLLEFFYRLIPNYGVVIIIMALFIKIVTYPLTQKSYGSMKRMQLIQPKVQELQEKYKNNKQVLQQKTMELYKEEKVNPMGGCLPLLLQLPLLYGLFIVFRTAIEFRGAPFFLWMKDLSAPDALFSFGVRIPLLGTDFNVLPIIMTVLMIVQQKMTGTGMGSTPQQQQQQKMMLWLMPAMMFFLFYNFSSGLVLYYTVFNALTILQQKYITNKQIEKSFAESHPAPIRKKAPPKKK